MKPQTTKLMVLSVLTFGSAIGVALTPSPANFGFAFLLGLVGLELISVVRRNP